MALGVPGRLRPWIITTFGTTRVVGRQPNASAAFIPGENLGTHFQSLSPPQGTWFCRKEPRKKSPVTPPGIDPDLSLVSELWSLTLVSFLSSKHIHVGNTVIIHLCSNLCSGRFTLTAHLSVESIAIYSLYVFLITAIFWAVVSTFLSLEDSIWGAVHFILCNFM
jgi:hypothetical protein